MPSLIITGHPCVGKTTFAKIIARRAVEHKSNSITGTVIINEESACSNKDKSKCYANSHEEKMTRSALKTEFSRALSSAGKNTLVILDSLNYIKGFRYELHCIAKEAEERHGVVWVLCDGESAKGWNRERKNQTTSDNGNKNDFYEPDDLMDELVLRYEPPDERNRWDKPLYRVTMSASSSHQNSTSSVAKDTLQKSVYNMHSLSEVIESSPQSSEPKVEDSHDGNVPHVSSIEKIADDILESFLSSKPLKEGQSTQITVAANENVLHEVDNITQNIITSLMSAQKMGVGRKFNMPQSSKTIILTRQIHLPEIRRFRRQYIKWVTQYPPEDTTTAGITSSFLAYIETQL